MSSRRSVGSIVVVAVAVLGAGAPSARADDHVSVFAGIGVGAATRTESSTQFMAFVDVRHWFTEDVGLFATASAHGMPDVETHGTFVGGGLSARRRWHTRRHGTHSLVLTAGLGRYRLAGFTVFNQHPLGGAFDDTVLGWNLRLGGEQVRWGAVIMGAHLAAYGGPGLGWGMVLQFGFGLSL